MRTSWRAMWVVLFAVAFGTNVPSPLLLVYRERLGLSATMLTAIFGVYATGLLPALLIAGPASDRHGRRPVVTPFVVLSAVASLLFLAAARSVPLLFAARFLQGMVSGVVFSVGSAWLTELSGPVRPGVAARRSTVALSAGWALGPLSAGLLGQGAVAAKATGVLAATALPYLVHLALMVVGLVAVARLPETLHTRRDAPLLDLGIPPGAGRGFALFVVPAALAVFTFPSLAMTVLPLLLQRAMPGLDVAVAGVVAGVTMFTGVAVQPWGKRLGALRAAPAGVAAGTAGLGLSLVADLSNVWPLLLPVAVLLGGGYGLCLAAGLTATERLAAPEARGALTASFWAFAYAGFAAPVLVSVVARRTGFPLPIATLATGAAALALLLWRGPGRQALAAHPPRGAVRIAGSG